MKEITNREQMDVDFNIFTPVQHYRINGTVLKRVRKILKISESEFARLGGWDRKRQQRMEENIDRVYDVEDTKEILRVLQILKLRTKDFDFFDNDLTQ